MTREQLQIDIRALENIRESALDQSWFGHEVDALTHAIEALKSSLARLDGPPPGHMRVRHRLWTAVDRGVNLWDSCAFTELPQREVWVTIDLPLPEPAAEVEGEVE